MEIESKPVVVVPSNAYYWNAESVGQAYRQQLDPRYQREEMAEPGSSGQGGADEEPRSITLRNKALYYSQGLRQ